MPASLTFRQARLVLPDRVVTGDLVIEDGVIAYIGPHAERTAGEIVEGTGLTVLPGVIDTHVHFREPGRVAKEDMASGSRAAAAGGVTAFLDMPNTDPPTTTVTALEEKLALAAAKSVVHFGFFMGATGENTAELNAAERACGVKVFMSSSTGPLLVSERDRLEEIFRTVDRPIAVHAEDEARLRERRLLYEESRDPADHARLRDVESALNATRLAVELSQKHGRHIHLLHVSSADEAEFLATVPRDRITAETCPHYLLLKSEDAYATLGTRAQCNPPVRGQRHQEALWRHVLDGTFDCIASDHAPHTAKEKALGYPDAPSGIPGVEWMLPLMLDQVNRGRVSLSQVARLLCEGPARCYRILRKGRLEIGFDGDIVAVDMALSRTIENTSVRSRAGWSAYEGWSVKGWPVLTTILGRPVFRDGDIVSTARGRALTFGHS